MIVEFSEYARGWGIFEISKVKGGLKYCWGKRFYRITYSINQHIKRTEVNAFVSVI